MIDRRKTRIVIVGAGFGGLYTFRRLHRFFHSRKDVTLSIVNKENYFLFTPLLHEVATGSISPENIVEPIRKVVGCCLSNFYLGSVESVSLSNKTIETSIGSVPFDVLVLALGSQTQFYDTPGAQEHAMTLKSLKDAILLKNKVIDAFEKASKISDIEEKRKLLHFVIVGGGPTGVELAAELSELIFDTFSKYYSKDNIVDLAKVTIVQKPSALLKHFSPHIQKKSLEVLLKKNIQVRLDAKVEEVLPDGLKIADGTFISSKNIIWVAGIKPSTINFQENVTQDRRGKLVVDEYMRLQRHDNVFVLGDMASFTPKGSEEPVPSLAQVATKQAQIVGDNIIGLIENKPLKTFSYKSSGNLVSLGQWMAAAEIGKFHFIGHLTWWFWRTLYLTKFISLPKKFEIALDWTVNLFSPRDISRI